MKTIRFLLVLSVAASCGLSWAQTNAPATKAKAQELEIDSDSGVFDGVTNRMVYIGHVFVTDHVKARLSCERLTVDLPRDGGNPTNIVAETNVVVDVLDSKGQTNHITADRAIYSYSVVGVVTNETITFKGGNPMPKVENPRATAVAEPMILNIIKQTFEFPGHLEMHFKQASGTNASPINFLQ